MGSLCVLGAVKHLPLPGVRRTAFLVTGKTGLKEFRALSKFTCTVSQGEGQGLFARQLPQMVVAARASCRSVSSLASVTCT